MTSMGVRQQQEDLERRILSGRAALSADSRGRRQPEDKCPIRTEFQRDRDRIVHSKAFRRLKHKTQVFIDPDEDHYRTRLTHTLEVAQIARTISRALRLNEDLTEAVALGHDLGHTPFGHAGERALDQVCREYLPSGSFSHSEQSLRVVDFIERDGQGLNLTWEVRNGILHHSKGSGDIGLDGSDGNETLEGKVVRISDRIAYINHDIDDSVRAGVLREEDLPADCVAVLGNRHSERISAMVADIIGNSMDKPELRMSPRVSEAMDGLKDFLFERVYALDSRQAAELAKAERLVKELFRHYVSHPELLPAWRADELGDADGRARVACDFIAGMTDRYAEMRYLDYFVPEPRSEY